MTSSLPKADDTLDMTGKACPLPLLFAHRSMKKLKPGQSLLLLSDDPATSADIMGWKKRLDYQSVKETKHGNTSAFLIVK